MFDNTTYSSYKILILFFNLWLIFFEGLIFSSVVKINVFGWREIVRTYIMCCISDVNQAVGDGRLTVELVGEVRGCDVVVVDGEVMGFSCVVI